MIVFATKWHRKKDGVSITPVANGCGWPVGRVVLEDEWLADAPSDAGADQRLQGLAAAAFHALVPYLLVTAHRRFSRFNRFRTRLRP